MNSNLLHQQHTVTALPLSLLKAIAFCGVQTAGVGEAGAPFCSVQTAGVGEAGASKHLIADRRLAKLAEAVKETVPSFRSLEQAIIFEHLHLKRLLEPEHAFIVCPLQVCHP